MGYHKAEIQKGVLGELSKIQEELDELKDAEAQNAKILMLCELADIVGALDHYVERRFPGVSLQDLIQMATMTRHAFKEGSRK